MQYIKITLLTGNGQPSGCYVDDPHRIDVPALFDGASVGERYILEAIEMEPEEFAMLEEFTGF